MNPQNSPGSLFRTSKALLGLAVGLFCAAAHLSGRPKEAAEQPIKARIDAVNKCLEPQVKSLEELYKNLHSHPELSYQEEKSAARMAAELRHCGFEVTEKVGGHGVVGVLKNGHGPTVLVRTDMDALPVIEKTGVPYASKVRVCDKNKQ